MGKIFNYLTKNAGMEKKALSPELVGRAAEKLRSILNDSSRLVNPTNGEIKGLSMIPEGRALTAASNLPRLFQAQDVLFSKNMFKRMMNRWKREGRTGEIRPVFASKRSTSPDVFNTPDVPTSISGKKYYDDVVLGLLKTIGRPIHKDYWSHIAAKEPLKPNNAIVYTKLWKEKKIPF